jgi:hypothetical protein
MSGGLGSFLSGMAAGYGTVMNFKRQADDDAWRGEQRANERKDRAEADALKGDLKKAGTTVNVEDATQKPDYMDNADVGQPGETPLTPSYAVNGVKFADREAADAEATKQNSSAARAARMAGVYEAHGKAKEAMDLRQSQQQVETGALTLNEAQRKHVNQLFDDHLQALGTHDDIASFVNNSQHDGEAGGLQVKAVPSADGKSVDYQRVMPDGTMQPTGLSFSNDTRGLAMAKEYLSKNVSSHDKLNNLHQLAQEKLQADQQANTAENQRGMLKVAQQNANTQEQWRRDQAGHLNAMEGIARDKAGNAGSSKLSPDDAAAYKSMDDERKNLVGLINKAKAEGMWTGSPEQKQLETQLAGIAIRQRQLLAQYGDQGQTAVDPFGIRTPPAAAGVQPPAQAPAAPPVVAPTPVAAQGIPATVVAPAPPAPAAGGRDYSALARYDFGSAEAQKTPQKVARRGQGERYTWNGNEYPTLEAANKARDQQLKKN